jgi:hypothetical protein
MTRRALRYASLETLPPSMRKLIDEKRLLAAVQPPKAGKYGNCPTTVDGIRFDSKREARYYESLKVRKAAGEVKFWLRQTALHLPGGTRYVVDFLEFHADGTVHFVDVKGKETPVFRLKKREVEHHYSVRIELV